MVKGLVFDLLQSMRADLASVRREAGDAGDSDAADLGSQVAVTAATRSEAGLVCGSRRVFFYIIM